MTANCNAAISVSDLPLPDTSMHVDVFGLEKGNGEYFLDVRNQSFIPEGRKPEIFIVFTLQLTNKDWWEMLDLIFLSISSNLPSKKKNKPKTKNPTIKEALFMSSV